MTTVLIHYKIRDRKTGLYSTGGKPPSWSKNGKTWTTVGGLMNHLSYLKHYTHPTHQYPDAEFYRVPSEWEIIPIEIRADETTGIPVADFIRNRKPKATIIIK
jgi:hypothetical protein